MHVTCRPYVYNVSNVSWLLTLTVQDPQQKPTEIRSICYLDRSMKGEHPTFSVSSETQKRPKACPLILCVVNGNNIMYFVSDVSVETTNHNSHCCRLLTLSVLA